MHDQAVAATEPTLAPPDFTIFADESGIHAGYRCFGIGAWSIPTDYVPDAERLLQEVHARYAFRQEQKWKAINNFRAGIEAGVEGIRTLLSCGFAYNAIIVRKDTYAKWNSSPGDGFWTVYYLLMRHIAHPPGSTHRVVLDLRSDEYPKSDEVLEIVTNHALRPRDASITVEMGDSKANLLIQYADLLTGAITSDTNVFLGGDTANDGKREIIERIAALIGWDALRYDTMPNVAFNIWHFPADGFRAHPATRAVALKL